MARADTNTSFRGSAYAFGNTEERLMRMTIGVQGREGDRAWDATASYGEVTAHKGHYDDCLNTKRNAFHLVVHETTGAFAPGADSFLNKLTHDAEALQAAGGERTVYSTHNENYYTHHSRRISISVRSAVAERAANNHQTLRRRLTRATVIGRQWARGA